MKQFKVLRSNYGFKGKYWTEGEVVNLEDEDTPPHHFQLMEEWLKTPTGRYETRRDPMKPEPYVPGKYPLTRKTGFAASVAEDRTPIETVTASKAAKNPK